jgi:hypothetical protein
MGAALGRAIALLKELVDRVKFSTFYPSAAFGIEYKGLKAGIGPGSALSQTASWYQIQSQQD